MFSSTLDKLRRLSVRQKADSSSLSRKNEIRTKEMEAATTADSIAPKQQQPSIVDMINNLKDLGPDQVRQLPQEAGVSLNFIQQLANELGDLTAAELTDKLLMPRTVSAKCSFAAFLASHPETQSYVSDKADAFVSHAWKYSLRTLVNALVGGDPSDRYVWLDMFVVNQHVRETLSQADWMDKFSSMLQTTGSAELVLYPFMDPIPVKRIWCVFEHACIVRNNIPYKVRMLPTDKLEFKQKVFDGAGVGLDFFRDLFGKINVELAQAYLESDRTAILQIVQTMGTHNVNAAAKNAIVGWLEEVLLEALNEAEESSMAKNKAHTGLGSFYQALGNYPSAEEHFRASVELSRNILPEGDLTIAVALNNLGIILHNRSKLQEALHIFEESIAIRTKAEGTESASMANCLSNRAEVLHAMGNINGAAESHREALEIKRRMLGNDAPAVALSLGNLGGAFRKLGKLDEAVVAYDEAISIYLKHPETGEKSLPVAGLYANYALVLSDRGAIDEAIVMQRKALELRRIVLGPRHLDVANCLHNLGGEYAKKKNQADLLSALDYYRQSCDIWKEQLGEDAPNVALSLSCQGNTTCDLSQVYGGPNPNEGDRQVRRTYWDEAIRLQRESLALRIRRLGENHVDTAFSMHNLAMLLKALNDNEAEVLGKKALAIFEQVFGPDHPNTKTLKATWAPGT